jgi:hypothetical protein
VPVFAQEHLHADIVIAQHGRNQKLRGVPCAPGVESGGSAPAAEPELEQQPKQQLPGPVQLLDIGPLRARVGLKRRNDCLNLLFYIQIRISSRQ